MDSKVGSFMNSAAAMRLPDDCVKARSLSACAGVQTPDASRVPALNAKEVTIWALAALAKSRTPFHSARVSTALKPSGGAAGAGPSESWKKVVLAQVPLTRR